ncbi:MAG: hypothetical protein AAB933_00550, partial [Patescibacteria group bacterium]
GGRCDIGTGTCSDGIKNGNETGIDTGGRCDEIPITSDPPTTPGTPTNPRDEVKITGSCPPGRTCTIRNEDTGGTVTTGGNNLTATVNPAVTTPYTITYDDGATIHRGTVIVYVKKRPVFIEN